MQVDIERIMRDLRRIEVDQKHPGIKPFSFSTMNNNVVSYVAIPAVSTYESFRSALCRDSSKERTRFSPKLRPCCFSPTGRYRERKSSRCAMHTEFYSL